MPVCSVTPEIRQLPRPKAVINPIEADEPSGWGLGEHPQHRVDCHVQFVQVPSNALFPELGHSSLAFNLHVRGWRPLMVRVVLEQAHEFTRGYLTDRSQLLGHRITSVF